MFHFRWFFLGLTAVFCGIVPVQSGGLLAKMSFRSLPSDTSDDDQSDSDDEVERVEAVGDDSLSDCSTDFSDTDESEHTHKACKLSEGLDVFECIKEIKFKEDFDAKSLEITLSPWEYVASWKEARQNILEIRRLLDLFSRALMDKNESVYDVRMSRLSDGGFIDLDLFEQSYNYLCFVYGQLLHDAVLVGFGTIVDSRSAARRVAREIPFLVLSPCLFCDASSKELDNYYCSACGESVIFIPDDRREFDQASGEIMRLLRRSSACKKVATLVLQQLNDR